VRVTIDQPEPSTPLKLQSFSLELHLEGFKALELDVELPTSVLAQTLIRIHKVPRHQRVKEDLVVPQLPSMISTQDGVQKVSSYVSRGIEDLNITKMTRGHLNDLVQLAMVQVVCICTLTLRTQIRPEGSKAYFAPACLASCRRLCR
jgi:hypothetical protein